MRISDRSDCIREIVDAWLEEFAETDGDEVEEAVDSYRGLATAVLEHGLGTDARQVPLPGEILEQAVTRVARISRRSHRSISSTLERFSRLMPRVLETLAARNGVPHDAAEVLRAAMSVDYLLDRSMRRLVEILEATAVRAHREQADAVAAVTEVLSHELDNRLGAARTASDILLNPQVELDDDGLERVSRLVRSSVDDALKTVEDVRTLVSSWGDPTHDNNGRRGTVRLPVLIRSIVSELTATARESDVHIDVAEHGVDCLVDAPRLRLILFNLVSNAVKYHDPHKDDRWVRIESHGTDEGRLRLEVTDNGTGIREDEIEEVFHYRRRANHGSGVHGSGLGLAIVSEAVDQLGGVVSVESELGAGTEFTVILDPVDEGG